MATNKSQGHVPAPTATGFSLEPPIMDNVQGQILAPTATGFPLEAPLMDNSQGHVHLRSTATNSSLNELVATRSQIHL
jgi:hypothetical protein